MSNSGKEQYMKNLIPILMKQQNMGIKQLGKACPATTLPTIYSTADTDYLDMVSSRALFEISQALNCTFYDLFEVIE